MYFHNNAETRIDSGSLTLSRDPVSHSRRRLMKTKGLGKKKSHGQSSSFGVSIRRIYIYLSLCLTEPPCSITALSESHASIFEDGGESETGHGKAVPKPWGMCELEKVSRKQGVRPCACKWIENQCVVESRGNRKQSQSFPVWNSGSGFSLKSCHQRYAVAREIPTSCPTNIAGIWFLNISKAATRCAASAGLVTHSSFPSPFRMS